MSPAPFAYATSHRIDLVGTDRLRKHLADEELLQVARGTKPAFLHDVRREPAVYRELLGPAGVGPVCLASGEDWVELELLDAHVLWQVGEPGTWVAVAAWVAGMHRRLAAAVVPTVPLLVHDARLLGAWHDRAVAAGLPAPVLDAHERACRRLMALPPTVLHGDLYASNVLVDDRHPSGIRVWPVDWELAAIGPAVLDVAALTAGSGLGARTRAAMVDAYLDAAGADDGERARWPEDLVAARLHQCVQWLTWSPGWQAPPQHRHDWLAEALELAGAR